MQKKIRNICCIGAGYVGGPTMAVIAKYCEDIQVNVVDISIERIKEWNNPDTSKIPIYEPGLSEIIESVRGKNLHFSTDLEENISSADMIFISVNTPTKTKGKGSGKASDLKWVEASARQIAKFSKGQTIVVEKSTLPVKTAQTIKEILESYKYLDTNSPRTFEVLSNPEFLAEGSAINDLENPDRVLIGGNCKKAITCLEEIYLNWVSKEKIIKTNLWSSELSKLTANAFLSQRISSINSISALCEATGADIKEVSKAVGMDRRIGNKFLNSGPGFGGSCFKKDILNLIYICDHYGLKETSSYWEKVIEINDWQQKRIIDVVLDKLFGTITGKTIAILGFAFKANTNDTRESPAIKICEELIIEGAKLKIFDPKVNEIDIENCLYQLKSSPKSVIQSSFEVSNSISNAISDCDGIIVVTDWIQFSEINWVNHIASVRLPCWIFDTRSIINSKLAKESGFKIWTLGSSS
tara:strand:- start:2683 stop:4089 length:1407 start_codon:yes stop_codon:yes gene_type:complete